MLLDTPPDFTERQSCLKEFEARPHTACNHGCCQKCFRPTHIMRTPWAKVLLRFEGCAWGLMACGCLASRRDRSLTLLPVLRGDAKSRIFCSRLGDKDSLALQYQDIQFSSSHMKDGLWKLTWIPLKKKKKRGGKGKKRTLMSTQLFLLESISNTESLGVRVSV